MADELVEMVVESVRVHMPSSQHVVILKEVDRERYLPIWIGPWEANAIAMRLQGISAERPLTHDLFATTLEELGVTVRRVVISSLAAETFHAQLFLDDDGREVTVDSRPSDALALAVRSGVRVFAAESVLDQAGVRPEDPDADPALVLETTDGVASPADPRLDVFRDFVNSLDMGGEPETREGPQPD
jgi:bifunctional DNase/RNase